MKSRACFSAAARLRADVTTQHATDLIDIQFGHSDEWAVIHDLRLRVGGHAVQISHVLINSALRVICLDTRFLDFGLDIDAQGRCVALNRHKSRTVASPLNKMAKDIRMIRTHLQDKAILPRHFWLTQRACVKGFVLTHPGLRLGIAATSQNYPDVNVHSSSALFALLWKQDLGSPGALRCCLPPVALQALAERLIEWHEPVYSSSLLESDSPVSQVAEPLLERKF